MFRFIIAVLFVLSSASATANSMVDITNGFSDFHARWDACSSQSECAKVLREYHVWFNHPNTQVSLTSCERDAKCYTAMMNFTLDFLNNMSKIKK